MKNVLIANAFNPKWNEDYLKMKKKNLKMFTQNFRVRPLLVCKAYTAFQTLLFCLNLAESSGVCWENLIETFR